MNDHQIGRRSLAVALGGLASASIMRPGRAQIAAAAQAAELPRPTQAPLLTVSGRIRTTNEGSSAVFDRPMLEGLGRATITTTTPWHDGSVRFDGVPMARVMEAVGAAGQTLTAIALNDYSTDIPIADFARFGVILATHRNGAPMRVSDRGPLFIIYPYDAEPELRTRLYYSRSAWSVAQLVVR